MNLQFLVAVLLLTEGIFAAGAQQILYVGDSTGKVSAIQPDGSVHSFYQHTSSIEGLATDSLGNVYAAGDNSLIALTPDGSTRTAATSSLFHQGISLVRDRSGNFYESVINFTGPFPLTTNRILKIAPSGVVSVLADNLDIAGSLAIDRNDNLFFSGTGHIDEIKPDGTRRLFRDGTSYRADALAFDTEGNLYQANSVSGDIERYSSLGQDLGIYLNTGASTVAFAFDQNDDLYTINYFPNYDREEIDKYNLQGQPDAIAGFNAKTLNSSLAFSPAAVPEPGSMALLAGVVGAGLLVLHKRRR